MTLVPTDSIVGVVAKLNAESPAAAEILAEISLYEAFMGQLDAVRAPMEVAVYKNLAEINAVSRRALLRTHVSKALEGEEEPDDAELVEGLAILEEHVEKGLAGWLLDQFNRQHPRDEGGRFTSGERHTQGPQEKLQGQGNRQQSAIDLAGLTLGANQRQGQRLTRGIFNDDGKPNTTYGDDRASQWWGQTEGTQRQAYNRLKMTGDLLTRASAPGTATNFVGGLAQLAGDIGPEAEKVLGPGIRRTAYRYRGTERRPDRTVVATVAAANRYAEGLNDPELAAETMAQINSEFAARRGKYPPAQIAAENSSPRMTPDKRLLTVRGDAAVAALIGAMGERSDSVLPDLDLTRLSLESGEMPPSQGVIITADGKIATQAVGYNGDHYLPFDLRNLGALQGGQYVRSRATGGLTTEDIYTGLMTGARQVQVVSNSGVFTIEFDPDLRGGRRYSDKARRMIERYGSMLEAIDTKELYEPGGDLPPEVMSELRTKAVRASRSQEEFTETFDRLVKEERLKAANSDVSMDELEEGAVNFGRAQANREAEQSARAGKILSPQQKARIAADAAKEYRTKNQPTVRRMKLDGVGYDNAMRALKQEFPYYIRRAEWRPLDDWLNAYGIDNGDLNYRSHAPKDKGYVERGQTNARGTRSGGFRSAREVPPRRRAAAAAPQEGAAPKAEGQQAPATQKAPAAQGEPGAQKPAPTTADLAKPDSPLVRTMGTALTPLLAVIEQAKPAGYLAQDEKEADAEASGPLQYFAWKAGQLSAAAQPGLEGRVFANWLINEATPQQHDKVMKALAMLPNHIKDFPLAEDYVKPEEATKLVQRFAETLDLLEPFAPVEPGEDPAMTEPVGKNPKPPRMPGVPDITSSADDFEYMEGKLRVDLGDELAKDLDFFAELTPEDRASEVKDAYEAAIKQQTHEAYENLANYQTAWSFVHARELAERLRPLVGTDAGPKAPAVSKRLPEPDRDLSYLQVVRDSLEELDLLLGRSR